MSASTIEYYPIETKPNDLVIKKIKSFAYLPNNWDNGHGIRPNERVIELALMLHVLGKNLSLNTEPKPLTEGGISLTFYRFDEFLDIDIYPDHFDMNYEVGVGLDYNPVFFKKNVELSDIISQLQILKNKCHSLSEQSILPDIAQVKRDLNIDNYSDYYITEFQSFLKNAQYQNQQQYAIISDDTINVPLAIQ